jgi:hypothetical protein
MILADSVECRVLQQLLGERRGPLTRQVARCHAAADKTLWETLRLVPLEVHGLVRVTGHPDVVALVMSKMTELYVLECHCKDMRMLLFVVCELIEVRG